MVIGPAGVGDRVEDKDARGAERLRRHRVLLSFHQNAPGEKSNPRDEPNRNPDLRRHEIVLEGVFHKKGDAQKQRQPADPREEFRPHEFLPIHRRASRFSVGRVCVPDDWCSRSRRNWRRLRRHWKRRGNGHDRRRGFWNGRCRDRLRPDRRFPHRRFRCFIFRDSSVRSLASPQQSNLVFERNHSRAQLFQEPPGSDGLDERDKRQHENRHEQGNDDDYAENFHG